MNLNDYQDQLDYIIQTNVPLLFIDTCAYLDVLRMVHRDDMSFGDLDALYDLVKLIVENKLLFVTSEIVRDEFLKNHDTTLNELKKRFKEYQHLHKKITKATNKFSPIQKTYSLVIDDTWIKPLNIFCQNSIMQHSIIFEKTDEDDIKAIERLRSGKAPSKQGGGSLNDCAIFETLLRVVGDLRRLGFDKEVCFISSNTKDFGKVRDCFVQDDLDELDILFANHFSHAKSLLI